MVEQERLGKAGGSPEGLIRVLLLMFTSQYKNSQESSQPYIMHMGIFKILVFHFQLSLFTKTKPSMIVLYSQVKSLFI
jgi:hypothetical protein